MEITYLFATGVLRKLWRGQYPLVITFWGFYVLGYLATFYLTTIVAPLFSTQPWRLLSVLLLVLPYNVVSTVGVWRSANAYPLTRWWPNLAKVGVCIWGVQIASSLANGVVVGFSEWSAAFQ